MNLVILGYLVWNRRLFGARGGAAALEAVIDWDEILATPISLDHTPTRVG